MRTEQFYLDEIKKIDDLRETLWDNLTVKKSHELAEKRAWIYRNYWRFIKRSEKV